MAIQAITSFNASPKNLNKVNQNQGQTTSVSFGNAPNMAISATKKVAGGLTLAALLTAAAVFFTGCGSSATGADPEEVIASSSSEEIIPESSSSEEVVTHASSSSKEDSSSSVPASSSSVKSSSSSEVKSSSSEAASSSSVASSSSAAKKLTYAQTRLNYIFYNLGIVNTNNAVAAKKIATTAKTTQTDSLLLLATITNAPEGSLMQLNYKLSDYLEEYTLATIDDNVLKVKHKETDALSGYSEEAYDFITFLGDNSFIHENNINNVTLLYTWNEEGKYLTESNYTTGEVLGYISKSAPSVLTITNANDSTIKVQVPTTSVFK